MIPAAASMPAAGRFEFVASLLMYEGAEMEGKHVEPDPFLCKLPTLEIIGGCCWHAQQSPGEIGPGVTCDQMGGN